MQDRPRRDRPGKDRTGETKTGQHGQDRPRQERADQGWARTGQGQGRTGHTQSPVALVTLLSPHREELCSVTAPLSQSRRRSQLLTSFIRLLAAGLLGYWASGLSGCWAVEPAGRSSDHPADRREAVGVRARREAVGVRVRVRDRVGSRDCVRAGAVNGGVTELHRGGAMATAQRRQYTNI